MDFKLANNHPAGTGEFEYVKDMILRLDTTTFANKHLRPDFIADIKRRELEAPGHHRQFVLNDFSEEGGLETKFLILKS